MAMRYEIKWAVVDGDHDSPVMDANFAQCELSSIRFFDAGGAQVIPSAGTVSFKGSPDGVNWRNVQDGEFSAADAYSATRTPPYAEGLMICGRLTFSGIVGASSFSATIWRNRA